MSTVNPHGMFPNTACVDAHRHASTCYCNYCSEDYNNVVMRRRVAVAISDGSGCTRFITGHVPIAWRAQVDTCTTYAADAPPCTRKRCFGSEDASCFLCMQSYRNLLVTMYVW